MFFSARKKMKKKKLLPCDTSMNCLDSPEVHSKRKKSKKLSGEPWLDISSLEIYLHRSESQTFPHSLYPWGWIKYFQTFWNNKFCGRIFFFTSFPLNLGGCVFVELGGKSLAIPLCTHQVKENRKRQLLFWGFFYYSFSIVQVFLPTKHITNDTINLTICFSQLIDMTSYNFWIIIFTYIYY